MLRRCPTQQNQKDLQVEYTTMYWGGFGEEKKEREEDCQQMLAQGQSSSPKKKELKIKSDLQIIIIQLQVGP